MGGLLGFGLSHEYALDKGYGDELLRLTELLKGTDAAIMQACRAFGLRCTLNISYEDKND